VEFAVVVPAYLRGDEDRTNLSACLAALSATDPPPAELLIVDDGSPEPVAAAIAESDGATCVPYARVVRVEHRGPAAARNAGAAMTDAPILVFVDADVVVPRDTFARLDADLTAVPDAAAVWATVTAAHAHRGLVTRYKNLAHRHFTLSQRHAPGDILCDTRHLTTMLAAVRREAFEAAGGFDETFDSVSVEDIELGRTLVDAGHRVVLDLALAVEHRHRFTPLRALRNDLRKVRHHARTTLARRRRNAPSVAVEDPGERRQLFYLFTIPLGPAAVSAAITGHPLVATAALATLAIAERHLLAHLAREGSLPLAIAALPWMAIERCTAATAILLALADRPWARPAVRA
jgi:GT2 family glycosyltransferase